MAKLADIQRSLTGVLISKIEVDFRVTLVFLDHGSLALSCPFEIRLKDRSALTIDPEGPKTDLLPVLEFVNESIQEIMINHQGILLTASNGMKIRTYSDPDYESWKLSLNGPEGALVIALPGKDLAIWGPSPSQKLTDTKHP
ncbi:DUF6188 family protein [Klugiella xanthotipulae]|uniref:DUF6188 family protein n=1 Tax=Klugiella xanthotipulae TaxID=244735 RepID=UPI00114ED58C|nr:DUF6188 family protein [Klugiella xanthotipulae]